MVLESQDLTAFKDRLPLENIIKFQMDSSVKNRVNAVLANIKRESAYLDEMSQEEINPQIKRILENPTEKDYCFIKGTTDEGRKGRLSILEEQQKLVLSLYDELKTENPDLEDYSIVVLRGVNFSGHYGRTRKRIYIPLEK